MSDSDDDVPIGVRMATTQASPREVVQQVMVWKNLLLSSLNLLIVHFKLLQLIFRFALLCSGGHTDIATRVCVTH